MIGSEDDRGSVTPFAVVILPALILMAGLVFDGGMLLSTRREGVNVVHGAARVGAQEIDSSASRNAGSPVMDKAAAKGAAEDFLARKGWDGYAIVFDDRVQVTATRDKELMMLASLVEARTITVTSTARPVQGVNSAEN